MIAGLPYDAEVEYLESTGTQWIDTGYAFQDNFSWEITFNGLGYGQALFGGRDAEARSSLLYQRSAAFGEQTTIPIAGLNGTRTPFVLADLKSGLHTVKAAFAENKGSVWVDGVAAYTNTSFSGKYISGVSHAIFADNYGNGDVREFAQSKVYSLQIWQNDVLVRDFVPVRFTNELGLSEGAMYDRVSRKLFRNAGTGAFVIGPDVATPVMGLHFFKSQIKTAKDYVQNGLIAMWDGIENAGYGQHDDAATTWADLTGRGSGWLLKDSNTTQVFEVGPDYVKILNDVSWNGRGHCTPSWSSEDDVKQMEIVLDNTDFSETASSRICSFGVGNGAYTSQMTIRDGNLFQFGYKKYPLLQLGTGLNAISFDKDTARGLFNGVLTDSLKSTVGSGYVYYSPCISAYASQPATGIKIKSLRIYNRVLTEAEMLANYAIDKLRFNFTPSS